MQDKIIKYRMIFDNGYIETTLLKEAEKHGNFVTVEEIIEDNEN